MAVQRKLGRRSDHRQALLRNQVQSLLDNGKMVTTLAKAKETRQVAEKMITLGKRGDLHARRQALAYLYDKKTVAKLFDEIAPKYKDRNGGYVRVLKMGPRRGDGAEMALIELV